VGAVGDGHEAYIVESNQSSCHDLYLETALGTPADAIQLLCKTSSNATLRHP
jgi:hypothetical protein